MNVWLAAAALLLLALVPCAIGALRGEVIHRLVALEMTAVVVTFELELLAQATGRSAFQDEALALALLSFGGGLVFARFLERWT